MKKTITTHSPTETKRLGARLGRMLNRGDVILLLAPLGAGKTTFVQGVVKPLGVKDRALSPTFILAQSLKGKIPVHHLDFYRMSAEELMAIGVQDYFTGGGAIEKGVLLIEWAERFKGIWPSERLEVRIKIPKRNQKNRVFTFRGVGKRYARQTVQL